MSLLIGVRALKRRASLLLCCAVFWLGSVAAVEDVSLYFYHQQPPFELDVPVPGQGLSYQFSDLLNQHLADEYLFAVQAMPRQRLNWLLRGWIAGDCPGQSGCDDAWVVLWVTPYWGWGSAAQQPSDDS